MSIADDLCYLLLHTCIHASPSLSELNYPSLQTWQVLLRMWLCNVMSVLMMWKMVLNYRPFVSMAFNAYKVNWVIIGSDNVCQLSTVWYQAITWTKDELSTIKPKGTHVIEWESKYKTFNTKFLMCSKCYVVCKMSATLYKSQTINSSFPSVAYMRQWTGSPLAQVLACRLFGDKPLPEPMLAYCQLDN